MPKRTKGLAKIGCMVTIFLLFTCLAYAQNAVTGKVINKTDNTPVPGATVQVKGSKVITQSGADGAFSINLPNGKGTLVISAVGFGKLEVLVTAGVPAGGNRPTGISPPPKHIEAKGFTRPRKKDSPRSGSARKNARTEQNP